MIDDRRAEIADVSGSGVRVSASEPHPSYARGESIELALRFDGARASWWRTEGCVVRVDADGAVAVTFPRLPIGLAEAIRAELEDAAETQDAARVLVVDPDAERRGRLVASFRATGMRVTEAATPLDAIVRLGESREYPQTVVIADTYPACIADELRTYLELEHADLALVRTLGGTIA